MEPSMNEKIEWYEDNAPGYPGGSAHRFFGSEDEYESYCDQVCEKWNEHHPECVACNERGHEDEMLKSIDDEPIHEDCAEKCFKCEYLFVIDTLEMTDDGEHMICSDCIEENNTGAN